MQKKRKAYNKIELTPAIEKYIRNNFYSMRAVEIAENLGLKQTWVRTKAYEMGLKKLNLEYWTDEQVLFLKENYRTIGDTEIAEYFNENMPKKKKWCKRHIDKKRSYLGLKRTPSEVAEIKRRNIDNGRFAVCASRMWDSIGRPEIGEIRVHIHNGVKRVVIKTENGFVHRNRWLWEQHYGSVPSNVYVRQKDGTPLICDVSDLYLVTQAENAIINNHSDKSIAKKTFKIPDENIPEFIDQYSDLINLKRQLFKLNQKIKQNEPTNTK